MNRLLLLSATALLALPAAADSNGLLFKTADGASHEIAAKGLSIYFADGKMVASNASQTLSLNLADLTSMEFAAFTTVDLNTAEIAGKVAAFDANGIARGEFDSIKTAVETLPAGLYILKSENGQSTKINLKK